MKAKRKHTGKVIVIVTVIIISSSSSSSSSSNGSSSNIFTLTPVSVELCIKLSLYTATLYVS